MANELLGAWLVLASFARVSLGMVVGSAVFMHVGHQATTALGYLFGMRATAR